ncbi:MAG: transcription-repair coupling factor [Deltaproteobacteria bacterium]|nr:transcription-repair coupling factor [Deltaproteobacteria bacterium]
MFMNQNQVKITLNTLMNAVPGRKSTIDCVGFSGAEKAYAVSRLYEQLGMPTVVVASSPKSAKQFCDDLRFFFRNDSEHVVEYFPPYNILPFKFMASHNETAASRLRTLYHLTQREKSPVVVTTVAALMKKIIPKKALVDYSELVLEGEEVDRDGLVRKLVSGGYMPAAIVEEPGDFCARGGILDIFSPLYPDPVRIEFFGDFVESIRFFSAATQRTRENTKEAVIIPAKEVILKEEEKKAVIARIREQGARLNLPVTEVRKIVGRIKEEGVFNGIESFIGLIYPGLESLFEYVPEGTLWVSAEVEAAEKSAKDAHEQFINNFESAIDDGSFAVEPHKMYFDWRQVKEKLDNTRPLEFKILPVILGEGRAPAEIETYQYHIEDNTLLSGELRNPGNREQAISPLVEWLKANQAKGYVTAVTCATVAQTERLKSLLAPYGIPVRPSDVFPYWQRGLGGRDGRVYLCLGKVSTGFVWPAEHLAVVTEREIFGARKRRKKSRKGSTNRQLLAFEDLKTDDLVVHEEHGIGQYKYLKKLDMAGFINDFILIVYRDGDKLYLPVERMNLIQKYMGVEGTIPVLDKMGGVSWGKIKQKAKKSAEKIAGELLKLYAVRKVNKGFGHAPVEDELGDFEAGFLFEETADQLRAIEDVLADMQKPTPMDRLVCGDVGYGKTEVAMRAAFMSVFNNKQVAVLVPTTVLAEQHYASFSERFSNYPVNVACLSRFRKKGEQKKIVEGLKSGDIDIVIGTHRLLQKDIGFKELGLFVLDEEQRFGVRHKEKLKRIRSTVDVLALTATPIPRTLHMSLVGVRDVSLIATPPEYRQSIITYICEFDEGIAREAIRKELKRKGQIFFVHNNINTIEKTAGYLKTLVPEVRLDIAHGRMDEKKLEGVMLRFMRREIDLLVCTTIIESGLDIPSANTIIINRADRFGLAQMYQLRGRVGRSEEQAYAYLFIPDESYLGRAAQKRLKVLMEHSDLGSGFQIAMSDLQIRGGGTILGASQSGHIAAVGYDMFLKLMEESISELKGMRHVQRLEPEINMALSAYVPEAYIEDIDIRLSIYRRLAKMTDTAELSEVKKELIDRFGTLPDAAGNLLLKILLKILARKAGVARVDISEKNLSLHFSEAHQENPTGIVAMITAHGDRFRLTPGHILKTKLSHPGTYGRLTQAKNILKDIALHVNP